MKNTVRFISFILCLVMLLGCVTIQAEDDYYQIKSDYVAKIATECTVDEVFIKADYGKHNGYDIVVMGITGRLVSPAVGTLLIGGITFTFGYEADIASFYAYRDGEFIHVKDAFDTGLLGKSDIYNIAVKKGDIEVPRYREIWSGDGITMTLEETAATLYISGEGRTDDYGQMFIVGGLGLENYSPVGGNTAIKHVVVEEGITYLGENLFSECNGIETVELPVTLEEIGDRCFDGCNITHVVFPEGIKRIGNFCFESKNISTLTFYGNAPKTKEYPIFEYFEGTVYYPKDNSTWTKEFMAKYNRDITWETWSAPKIENVYNKFEDVKKNVWYTDAVQFVYDTDMMIGTSPVCFSPNMTMTRAQVVQVLFNLSGENKEDYAGKTYFEDVSENAWYAPAINWAYENRITSGVDFDRFAPNQLVKRGEFAAFLLNFAMELGCTTAPETADLKSYDDYRELDNWSHVGMAWAVHEGIITGMTETTLAPRANANRAQAARMLMKYYEYLNRSRPVLSEVEQAIADYVCENGEHSIGMGEYEYAIKEDGKKYSIQYGAYGSIKFSYKTSPDVGGSPGPASYEEGLSFYVNGLAEEYVYYYYNTTESYLITSSGVFTPNGFVEKEFENKNKYPSDEEAYAMRDIAMSELAAFIEKTMNELGMTTNDLFTEK